MSLAEVLPAIRSLPRSDQVRLVHMLIEELTADESQLAIIAGHSHEVWMPEDNSQGAAELQKLLDADPSPLGLCMGEIGCGAGTTGADELFR